MLNVAATWDARLRRWRYRLPKVGWAASTVIRTTYVSSNDTLAREARSVAGRLGVKLPKEFQLVVTR
jgi:hypothetical protein